MGITPLLGPLVGGGPWKSRLSWAQMALALFIAISGPKKGPTPSNGPQNGFAPIKIITSRAIYNKH
jgi:hypothetical protein